MKTKYRIIPSLENSHQIIIHPSTALKLGINHRKTGYFRFGIGCAEVKIMTSSQIEPEEIILDYNIIDDLAVPLFIKYEIIIKGNEIVIGPYIGILIHKKEEVLDKNISVYTNYVYDYEEIGGAILVFPVNGIQMEAQRIQGYLFNPETKKWEKGIYSYPAALFKRTGMNRKLRDHMYSLMGDAIFNNYIFDKWEMYQWLSEFDELKQHLAESMLYTKESDLKFFLGLYDKVYVKPIGGSQGLGIMEITKKEDGYNLCYMEDYLKKEVGFNNEKDVCKYTKPLLKKGRFMIQKGIDLIHTNGRKNDFRLLVVKNKDGFWEDFGMVVRHGVEGSIISNVSGGGSAEIGEDFLKNHLNLSDDEVYRIRKEISLIAIKAARAIEECGIHCGNLGIDMGIDEKGKIWIIEMNNKDPNHTIAIDAKDRQMFYRIKRANMLYAKRMAGF